MALLKFKLEKRNLILTERVEKGENTPEKWENLLWRIKSQKEKKIQFRLIAKKPFAELEEEEILPEEISYCDPFSSEENGDFASIVPSLFMIHKTPDGTIDRKNLVSLMKDTENIEPSEIKKQEARISSTLDRMIQARFIIQTGNKIELNIV